MESLVKFIPAVTITTRSSVAGPIPGTIIGQIIEDSTTTPDQYQFILTATDWHLLQRISVDSGSESGPTAMLDYMEVVTCDAAGNETTEPADKAGYYRCRIWHCDLHDTIILTQLKPADFNAYLGETQLIPIVHDLIEAYREHVSSLSA